MITIVFYDTTVEERTRKEKKTRFQFTLTCDDLFLIGNMSSIKRDITF